MSSTLNVFKELHQTDKLFILPNAWDARSAQLFQEKGFSAVATSSAAVAGSLGYEDGEQMPFDDYLFVVRRILAAVSIPLSVDLEMGYGTTVEEIYNHIRQLADLGVAGINLEDSVIGSAGRILKDADVFARTIEGLRNKLTAARSGLFLNIRCDTYLLSVAQKQAETRYRLKHYEAAGADGIFLPCISAVEDIADAVAQTRLLLNVMCVPGLPGFEQLSELGVKRVSMGPFLFNKVYDHIGTLSHAITAADGFAPLFS